MNIAIKAPKIIHYASIIDLRLVSTRKRDNRVPNLIEILNDAVESAKDPLDKSIVTAEDIIKLFRQGEAIIIYDGLDEKTVHFTTNETNEFVRQLWSIREEGISNDKRQGKILISCRTHYFRDVFEQNSLFLGRDREGRIIKEYLSCVILPFDDRQIREYFKKHLQCNDNEIERLIDLLDKVHNLRELAKRPYTLSLISEFIPDIEKMGIGGKIFNPASLYELIINNWFMRDYGKHEFNIEHKKTLMKAIALKMHIRAEKSIGIKEIETWLDEWLYRNPIVQSVYANINRETLKKDLRTATFIIREQESDFCFAHTSLQEYFLARHIIDAILAGRDNKKDLAMPFPSSETIDFAIWILQSDSKKIPAFLENIKTIFENGYEKQVSELCLGLWQGMYDKKMEAPEPKVIRLEGANLLGWDMRGINLSRAVFDNANMEGARFHKVQLTDASFKAINLRNTEFLNCKIQKGCFQGASLQGSVWRDSDLSFTDWQGANIYLADFVRCNLTGSNDIRADKDTNIVLCNGIEASHISDNFYIDVFVGHSDSVYSCVVTTDNKWIISASRDNTLKVWDMESGGCIKTLKGHSDSVNSCVVTTDNKWIISASRDKTLKVWDMESGGCIKTLVNLPEYETAAWDCSGRMLLYASSFAWRWIGISAGMMRFPIEALPPSPKRESIGL